MDRGTEGLTGGGTRAGQGREQARGLDGPLRRKWTRARARQRRGSMPRKLASSTTCYWYCRSGKAMIKGRECELHHLLLLL